MTNSGGIGMKIGLDSDISKLQNVSLKKVENNHKNPTECNGGLKESTVDLNSSRPEAVTYTARGGYVRKLNNVATKDNEVCDCKKPEFQARINTEGSWSTSPRIPVKAVVRMGQGDYSRLISNAMVPPLYEHIQECGKDNTKKYVVIDGVRYESEIPESERYKEPKTLIEMLLEEDKERAKHMQGKDEKNEYELAGMPKSDIIVGNSQFTAYGQIDEATKNRIEEVIGSIF